MTPGTGHGAGLRTRGAAWQGRLGASGTSRAWGGHTPLSVEGGVVPCTRVTGRGGWSRGSGGSILRGVVALAAVLCWAVAGWGQTAAPRALGSQHPLLVPHSSSGFPAPCLSSVLPNAKWAPKLPGETNQWPGSSSCQKPLPEAVPRPDAVTAALIAQSGLGPVAPAGHVGPWLVLPGVSVQVGGRPSDLGVWAGRWAASLQG